MAGAAFAAAVVTATLPNVAAAVPTNDDFRAAAALPFAARPVLVTADTMLLTTQTSETLTGVGCPAAMGRTAWWRLSGTGQAITVSTSGSSYNTVLVMYDAGTTSTPTVPPSASQLACNDDVSVGDVTSRVTFPSARGRSFLVQAGGRGGVWGRLAVTASAPRPPNDDVAAAAPLTAGAPATVSNAGAGQEVGEITRCGDDDYAGTIWFRWTADAVGDVEISATATLGPSRSSDTVMAVYRSGTQLRCADDGVAPAGGSRIALRVEPGDYLIQVGAHGTDTPALPEGAITVGARFLPDLDLDGDGSLRPDDCDDADATIRPGAVDVTNDDIDQDCTGGPDRDADDDGYHNIGALLDCDDANRFVHPNAGDVFDNGVDEDCTGSDAVNPDRDGDGDAYPGDCNDRNPSVRRGAVDTPRDGVDQNCDGRDAEFPLVGSRILASFVQRGDHDVLRSLTIQRAVKGSSVRVVCRPRCAYRARTVRVRASAESLPLVRHVRGLRLRRNSALEVHVQRPGFIAVVNRWTFRSLSSPKRIERCRWPGERRVRRCPL